MLREKDQMLETYLFHVLVNFEMYFRELDIQTEVVMNDIPKDLIFNCDQTAIQLVPTND